MMSRRDKNFRTMEQEVIFSLDIKDCKRGIASCRSAISIAKKYKDTAGVDSMSEQMGAFEIQIDMILSGDIRPADWV